MKLPGQETHHDITVTCGCSAPYRAVCVRPGARDRRVTDTAGHTRYNNIIYSSNIPFLRYFCDTQNEWKDNKELTNITNS